MMISAIAAILRWRSPGRLRALWLAPAPVPFFAAPPAPDEATGLAAARARLRIAGWLRADLGRG